MEAKDQGVPSANVVAEIVGLTEEISPLSTPGKVFQIEIHYSNKSKAVQSGFSD